MSTLLSLHRVGTLANAVEVHPEYYGDDGIEAFAREAKLVAAVVRKAMRWADMFTREEVLWYARAFSSVGTRLQLGHVLALMSLEDKDKGEIKDLLHYTLTQGLTVEELREEVSAAVPA